MTRERLLQFLYQTPIGILELDSAGNVGLMNAYATRYLFPLATHGTFGNLFTLLEPYLSDLAELVARFDRDSGTILSNRRFSVPFGPGERITLSLSIDRLDTTLYMAILADTTELVKQEERARDAQDEEAAQRGRMEIASSVLHDIGNAITGLSSSVSRLLSDEEWPEIQELQRLQGLLESQSEALSEVLGSRRESALRDFLRELIENLSERRGELMESYQHLANTVGHISETLALQRQYASEWVSQERPTVSLGKLIADAVAMQQAGFEKRGVRLYTEEGQETGRDLSETEQASVTPLNVAGDRTKLVRVFVNILKNAAEAFDRDAPAAEPARAERWVVVRLARDESGAAQVRIADNGSGFAAAEGEDGTEEGRSGKDNSRGIGLYSARRIVEGHGGSLRVSSPGPGQGSVVTVTLPAGGSRTLKESGA